MAFIFQYYHLFNSYNNLMCKNYYKRTINPKPTRMANRIFQRIFSPPPSATAKHFSTTSPVISTAVTILKHHRSKSRWTELHLLFPNGFTSTEASSILITIKNDPHLALRFFDWSCQHSRCNHNLLSYSTIIHIVARSRQKRRAEALIRSAFRMSDDDGVDLFEAMVKSYRKCDSASFVFDLLIKACLDCKKIDSAVEILNLLISRGINLNSRIVNLLILTVCSHRGADAGYEMYRNVFKNVDKLQMSRSMSYNVDVEIYNTLMSGYYREGEFEKVRAVWDEMLEDGVRPNECSYGVLLAASCDDGRMEEVERILEEMGSKRVERDVAVFDMLIGGYCKIGEMDKAEDYWREMVLNGVEATCVTHESFVNGYSKVGDIDAAVVASKGMSGAGFVARGDTIDGLVGELCGRGRVVDGLEVFKAAMENKEFVPNRRSYSLLVRGLCSEGMMDEALKLQTEMASKGFEPDAEVYSAFMDGYGELGNPEIVESLRKEMVGLHVTSLE